MNKHEYINDSGVKSTIFNMDCLEAMREMPDNHFDLAIVDPPYGINAEQGTNLQTRNRFKHKEYGWDSSPPDSEYFAELNRVSVSQIIWGANHFRFSNSPNFVVWDKGKTCRSRAFSDCELAWVSPNIKGFGVSGGRVFDGSQGMVSNNGHNPPNRIHPTQKPIQLYEWILDKYATCKYCENTGQYYEDVAGDGGSRMLQPCDCDCVNEDGSVRSIRILDTHLGSGSSRIAANRLGFEFVGYELDKDYFNDHIKRFENEVAQKRLF